VSRSWELFLRDLLEAARKVIRYAGDRQVEAFVADEMAYDATLRNLEVLGEAAKSIPEEIRQRYPEVDWRGVAGLRDIRSPRAGWRQFPGSCRPSSGSGWRAWRRLSDKRPVSPKERAGLTMSMMSGSRRCDALHRHLGARP
jgi:hypothetical protein